MYTTIPLSKKNHVSKTLSQIPFGLSAGKRRYSYIVVHGVHLDIIFIDVGANLPAKCQQPYGD